MPSLVEHFTEQVAARHGHLPRYVADGRYARPVRGDVTTNLQDLLVAVDTTTDELPSTAWLTAIAAILTAGRKRIDDWPSALDRLGVLLERGSFVLHAENLWHPFDGAYGELLRENLAVTSPLHQAFRPDSPIPTFSAWHLAELSRIAIRPYAVRERGPREPLPLAARTVQRWLLTPESPALSANALACLVNSWHASGGKDDVFESSAPFSALQRDRDLQRAHWRLAAPLARGAYPPDVNLWLKEMFASA